ncbi:MAG: hypothetical protein AAGA85_18305 [Bacteroidota bacterium]
MKHLLRLSITVMVYGCLLACSDDDDTTVEKQGELRLDWEVFDLGQSALIKLQSNNQTVFQINLYHNTTRIALDDFERVDILGRGTVDDVDFFIYGINAGTDDFPLAATYENDTRALSPLQFSDAEILVRRNASGGAGNIVAYEYESGTFAIDAQSESRFTLSWDMVFVNDDDPSDIVDVTGSYEGAFLFSEF